MSIGMCVGTYVGMGICAFVWRLKVNTKWFPQSTSTLFTVAVFLSLNPQLVSSSQFR